MRTVGFWAMSEDDNEILVVSFVDHLNGATITGTPTVAGVNCTATYLSNADGIVQARVTDGVYAGSVRISVASSYGQEFNRQIDLRFI